MSAYDCWHKCVVSYRGNTVNDEADVMSSGRLLHSFGPTEAKDWPKWWLPGSSSHMICHVAWVIITVTSQQHLISNPIKRTDFRLRHLLFNKHLSCDNRRVCRRQERILSGPFCAVLCVQSYQQFCQWTRGPIFKKS